MKKADVPPMPEDFNPENICVDVGGWSPPLEWFEEYYRRKFFKRKPEDEEMPAEEVLANLAEVIELHIAGIEALLDQLDCKIEPIESIPGKDTYVRCLHRIEDFNQATISGYSKLLREFEDELTGGNR